MARKNGQIGIRVGDELASYVADRAEREGATVSEIVRDALAADQARGGPAEQADEILTRICHGESVPPEEIGRVAAELPISAKLSFFTNLERAQIAAAKWLANRST